MKSFSGSLKWGPGYCSLYSVFLCGSRLSFLCKLQAQLTSTEELRPYGCGIVWPDAAVVEEFADSYW